MAAAVLLFLGYLVPSLVRRRQAVADSRVDDRFSNELRIVARGGSGVRKVEQPLPSTRALVASRQIARPREEPTVTRPTGMADRRAAQEARRIASVRAALAARRAEQAAAARRRLVLTLALAAVAAVAWTAVAVGPFSPLLAAFPTAVLTAVLWFGVRTARAERTEWAQVPVSLTTPRREHVAGPTYTPTQLRSHLPAAGEGLRWQTGEVPVESAPAEVVEDAVEAVEEIADDVAAPEVEPVEREVVGSWTPVPVPVPTYTLKPVAVRREAAPYLEDEQPATAEALTTDPLEVSIEDGIDLRAVLARRRAVGA
ncbi:hypothetical protein GCM10025875_04460 [Litorihabitans aurantiacus]|uniref:Uncharacterized protein n=1 Tax=Litorihabitans aurantiacus TaxID=1930061 RepID=A0AA37ULX2_9MICO|nr:hypothetical protein GCM10025875_04460 [Litorihabitans aurantiacus]